MQECAVKCVVVGDPEVGKAGLLVSYTTNSPLPDYTTSVIFDGFSVNIIIDGKTINLGLWDTTREDQYERLRPLSYPATDVFVLCFSLVSPASFENIKTKYCPEISRFCPNVPVILVGTKLDLREDREFVQNLAEKGLTPITYSQGVQMQEEIGAEMYVECSTITLKNVALVFEEAARTALMRSKSPLSKPNKRAHHGCTLQ
eukprot:Em0009g751a